jgi:hypothetical protein
MLVRVIQQPERGRGRGSDARVALVKLSGVYIARLSRASCRHAGRGLLTRLASVRLSGSASPDRQRSWGRLHLTDSAISARNQRAVRRSVGARRPVSRRGTIEHRTPASFAQPGIGRRL